MKKYIFSLMLSTAFYATCPVIAMNNDDEQTDRLMKETLTRIDAARVETNEKKRRAQEARRTQKVYTEELEIKAIKAEQKWARLYKLPPLLEGLIYFAAEEESEDAKEILKLVAKASEARKPLENAKQRLSFANYYLQEYTEKNGVIDPTNEELCQTFFRLSEEASEAHKSLISIKKESKETEAAWEAAAAEFFKRRRQQTQ